ncbi:MAG: YciI family protein [Solirubrobacteraceae bacterium]
MKYMLLLYGEQDAGPAPGTPEFGQMLEEYMAATEEMRRAGVLLDSSPLQRTASATTVRVREGSTRVSDGPFAEIKEMLGGYYLIDCSDLDAAVRWAAMIPAVKYGSIEIRPLMQMGPH